MSDQRRRIEDEGAAHGLEAPRDGGAALAEAPWGAPASPCAGRSQVCRRSSSGTRECEAEGRLIMRGQSTTLVNTSPSSGHCAEVL